MTNEIVEVLLKRYRNAVRWMLANENNPDYGKWLRHLESIEDELRYQKCPPERIDEILASEGAKKTIGKQLNRPEVKVAPPR